MSQAIVIRGRYVGQAFIPSEPLPVTEGAAELIVFPQEPGGANASIFDLFGKATHLRSAEDIDAQIQAERASWDER